MNDSKTICQNYPLKWFPILTVCYLIMLLCTCTTSNSKKNIDVSTSNIHFKSIRFDKELFACDTLNISNSVNKLGNKYPDFSAVYFNELTGFKGADTSIFYQTVKHFLTYKDYKNLYDTVQKNFSNTNDIDKQLQEVFKHIKYYFPNEKYGTVYYFISGLNNWSAVTVDTLVGVGLDMYLGKQYPFYHSVQIPQYQIERCEKEYIPINVSKTIYENRFPIEPSGKNLLDLMIAKGKQIVFAEYMNPTVKDEKLMGYNAQQLKWCADNEAMIWNYFAEKKLLYSTQWQEMMQYVMDGPTSSGMPAESPGNIGTYIGWKIVKKYMSQFPEKSLAEVLNTHEDGQTFMTQSGYKPR